MPQAGQGSRGRAARLLALCVGALVGVGASCGDDGTLVLVTVEGLDSSQAMELGVNVTLDGGVQHPFPRQSVASSLSASQQFGVLLPSGLGAAVTLEIDAFRGDCQVQSGSAPVALSGDPPITTTVLMGDPTMCAPLNLQVQGAGTITSPDAPSISCGPDAQCMYWLDAGRTYTLNATATAGDVYVEWVIDGVTASCDGTSKCSPTLPLAGHQITVTFHPLCDKKVTLTPVSGLALGANSSLRATWGIAGQEAWAVGDQGTVARFRAATNTWDQVTVKNGLGLAVQDVYTGVWGAGSPATLFIVGHGVANVGVAHVLQGPASVAGSASGPVSISETTSQILSAAMSAISGFDLMNLWAAGAGGTALKWNGTTQKFEAPMITGAAPNADFNGAWVSSDSSHTLTTVADKSQLFALSGSSWSTITATGTSVKFLAVAGTSTDLYAVGAQSSVVRLSPGSLTPPVVRKVATGADSNRTLSGVWAGSGYVFAVGDGGSIFCSRSSGVYWTRMPVTSLPNANFLGVYGSGKRLWVVGQNGTTGVVVEGTLP